MKLYEKLFELVGDFEGLQRAVEEGRTPAYLSGLLRCTRRICMRP